MIIELTEDEVFNILIGHINRHYGISTRLIHGYIEDNLTFQTLSSETGKEVVDNTTTQIETKGETREEDYIKIDLDKWLGGRSS